MIRILYVIENEFFGGGENAFSQIINGINKDRYEIYSAFIPHGLYFQKIKNSSCVLQWKIRNRFDFIKIGELARMIKNNKIDIVHSQGARVDFYARMAVKLTKVLSVSTIAMPPEGFDVNVFRKAAYILFDRLSEKYADSFIVVSEALKKRLMLCLSF